MSENWNEIGKKLYDAANYLRIDAVKKIVTTFQRNPQVIDWKDEQVEMLQPGRFMHTSNFMKRMVKFIFWKY
jgi:hypothetical protein